MKLNIDLAFRKIALKFRTGVFFITLIFLFSCTSNSSDSTSVYDLKEVSESDTISVVFENKDLTWDDLIEDTEVIFLKTGENFLGRADKLIFREEMILIADFKSGKIFSFNRNGDLLYALENQGQGPGKYIEIKDVGVDSDNGVLEVLDVKGQKIVKFNLETGYFLDYTRFSFYTDSFAPLNGGYRYFHNGVLPNGDYLGIDSLNAGIFVTNEKNEIREVEFDYSNTFVNKVRLVTHFNFFTNHLRDFLYVPLYSNDVYEVSGTEFNRKYSIDFGSKSLPMGFLESYKGTWRDFPQFLYLTRYAHSVTEFYESETHVTFSFFVGTIPYTAIYDKKLKKCSAYSDLGRGSSGFRIKPKEVFKDNHISLLSSEELLGLKELLEKNVKISKLKKSDIYNNLLDLINSNKSESPIVLLSTFKNVDSETLN